MYDPFLAMDLHYKKTVVLFCRVRTEIDRIVQKIVQEDVDCNHAENCYLFAFWNLTQDKKSRSIVKQLLYPMAISLLTPDGQ